jgi:hypothetical protein
MHCKDISLHEVDFSLTEENISEAVLGWAVYTRTEYIVLRNKEDLAVVKISKGGSGELFKKVIGVEMISLPEDTIFIKDKETDVLNLPSLVLVQERHPGKTVVVEGMFSHIGFVSRLQGMKLRVIDIVPPRPSKLRVLIGIALSSGFIDLPVIPEYTDVDLADKIGCVGTEAAMFPCRGSGLTADMPLYFLDGAPDVGHDITLIGCVLSNRIYRSIYNKDVPFVNICPADAVPDDGVKTIIKCCKIKEGYVIEGNTAKVPWGATVPEIVDAVNALFGNSE